MAGENKAFPGLMEVPPGLKEQIKSTLLYKIGNLTNSFENISFKRNGSFSKTKEKKLKRNNNNKKIKGLRPAVTSVFFIFSSHLPTELGKKQKTKQQPQTRVLSSYSAISKSAPLREGRWGWGWGRGPFTSALLSAEGMGPLVEKESQKRPW